MPAKNQPARVSKWSFLKGGRWKRESNKILDHAPPQRSLKVGYVSSPGSLKAPHGSWRGRLGVVWVQAAALDLFSPESASKALWLGLTCSCVFVYLHEQRSEPVRP